MGKLAYPVVLFGALFAADGSAAQVVHKCVGEGGQVVYQSAECGPGQDRQRTWTAEPATTTAADLKRRKARERAGSEYLRKLASRSYGRRSGGAAISRYADPKRCAKARARRAAARSGPDRLGLDELERLGDRVYEACK